MLCKRRCGVMGLRPRGPCEQPQLQEPSKGAGRALLAPPRFTPGLPGERASASTRGWGDSRVSGAGVQGRGRCQRALSPHLRPAQPPVSSSQTGGEAWGLPRCRPPSPGAGSVRLPSSCPGACVSEAEEPAPGEATVCLRAGWVTLREGHPDAGLGRPWVRRRAGVRPGGSPG